MTGADGGRGVVGIADAQSWGKTQGEQDNEGEREIEGMRLRLLRSTLIRIRLRA